MSGLSKFERWAKDRPHSTYKDFYREVTEAKLLSGDPHPTLGANLKEDSFGESGRNFISCLIEWGLKETDV
jgi:hypothetical protein